MSYASIVSSVRNHVPLAPKAFAMDEAKKAAIEFCAESRFLVDVITLDLVPGEHEYRLRGPYRTRFDQVLGVKVGDRPLDREAYAGELPPPGPPSRWAPAIDNSTITIWPIPSDSGTRVKVRGILVPMQDSSMLHPALYELWREALVSGTVARLCRIPKKPWTDPGLMSLHQGRFDLDINTARAQAASWGWGQLIMRPGRWV